MRKIFLLISFLFLSTLTAFAQKGTDYKFSDSTTIHVEELDSEIIYVRISTLDPNENSFKQAQNSTILYLNKYMKEKYDKNPAFRVLDKNTQNAYQVEYKYLICK